MKTLFKTLFIVLAFTACSSDDGGGTGTAENRPPEAFGLIAAPNGATGVEVKPGFSWSPATDPDGDEVAYSLFLGTDPENMTEIASGLASTSFTMDERLPLLSDQHWKVVAHDGQGGETESETFSFTTRNLNDAQQAGSFVARSFTDAVEFNGKLWVVGGGDTNDVNNDVWVSEDGANWQQATANAAFPARYAHTTLAYDGKLWIMGGTDGNTVLSDVWSSSDGIAWTEVVASNFPERYGHSAVVFDGKMWLIAGYDATHDYNEVWYSSDGFTWSVATYGADFSARRYHASVVFDNKMWVIGGDIGGDYTNDVWYSNNGIDWTLATDNNSAGFSSRLGHGAVVFDHKLWVIGGSTPNNNFVNDIWSSPDGATWTEVFSQAAFPGRHGHGRAVFDGRIWITGGADNTNVFNDVWYMD